MGFHYEQCALSGLTITEDDQVYMFRLIDCGRIENNFIFLEDEMIPSTFFLIGEYDDYGFIKDQDAGVFKDDVAFCFILGDILSKLIMTHEIISPIHPYHNLSFASANNLGAEYLNFMEAMVKNDHLESSDIYEIDKKICEDSPLLTAFSKLFIAPNKIISGLTDLPYIRESVERGDMEKAGKLMKAHLTLSFIKDIMREHNKKWKPSDSFTQDFDAHKALELNELANSFLKNKIQR